MVIPVPAEKIPPKPVTFTCKGCSGKVPIDGSRIRKDGTLAPEVSPAAAPQVQPVKPPPVEVKPVTPPPVEVKPVTPPQVEVKPVKAPRVEPSLAKAPRVKAPPVTPSVPESSIDLLEHVEIPEGTKLPSGLLISENPDLSDALRVSLDTAGSKLKTCASVAEAKELMMLQLPPLVIYVGKTITEPPFAMIHPITSLEPNQRRRVFIVLVGDNLSTMDGNAAFYHGVNLVIASKDAHRAHKALFSAMEYERLLTGYFLDTLKEIEGV